MSDAVEANFDGLIGPTHNYGGLSDGNLASARNAGEVSNPREAALQGLEKMRRMVRAGLVQGVLPPQPRPDFGFLADLGFGGVGRRAIQEAALSAPQFLKAAYSASAMWTANAATVSPSADTGDGRLHLTPANLSTMLHRSLEPANTQDVLDTIFGVQKGPQDPTPLAEVHFPLPMHADFSDEGAANHVRLCAEHGAPGVEVFVHGRTCGESLDGFPARQTLEACQAVARSHRLSPERTVHARQSRRAIAAGAFHNDVVCVGTLDTLFFHEYAFEETASVLNAIEQAADGRFALRPVMVPDEEVPLADAISSYLFNSQLVEMPGEERLVLIAPTETQQTDSTRTYCERLTHGNGPIGRVDYVDVRQSMKNGGGPACLRLRVVLTPEELACVHSGVLLDEARIDALQEVVRAHYRDRLAPADLADPDFAVETLDAYEAIVHALEMPSLA